MDSCYASVSRGRNFLDIIDDKWQKDCLSDDEIDLPEEIEEPLDVADLEPATLEAPELIASRESWNDLGLDLLPEDN
eukprot:CAMPEP_0113944034 /NCGR_PEP_ID=MMETSP1339-20121228/30596_1 /TAXON_ID=94617 /ORGANISM="Fibrocapsa japonica" /LENGTH=76 /DNA_ID=CAMNT_0000949087 /DNA_START=27 /DNA_END=257 /DNA_ORIENTATION=+ /assembly_acc=CAM_ASM_000762